MLLVVGLNLAIDRILQLPKLQIHEVQRTDSIISQPGGKGSNVARVFRQLGGDVTLVGCVGRSNADGISKPLQSMGVRVEAVPAYDGGPRICTVIIERGSDQHPTVINEESPIVDPPTLTALETRIEELLPGVDFLLVTGSLPRGLPSDFHARLIRKARERGVPAAVDATGDVLRSALEAAPTLVKVNLTEMTSALGPLGTDRLAIAACIRKNHHRLAAQTIVTMGEQGAVLLTSEGTWQVTPPRVSRVNPIGAGDAFAAGYLMSLMSGCSPDVALAFAAAVAASDAGTAEPGLILPSEIPELVALTVVRPLQNTNGY
jgi:1-phosphofructokinase family hexose kinase